MNIYIYIHISDDEARHFDHPNNTVSLTVQLLDR